MFDGAAWAAEINLKEDEHIVFYPTIGQRVEETGEWRCEIRGCIFEPEQRSLMTAALRGALELKDVELTAGEEKIFNERARLFLADHERRKKIFIQHKQKVFPAGKSGADGNFLANIRLQNEPGASSLRYRAALSPDRTRIIEGEVFLIEAEGLSVISDIDDTIKITEVRDRHATLRNTFLQEFRAVPGMAEFYQRLARERGAQFHYVSASPWQLYEPLAALVDRQGFPPGPFALKEFRWKSRKFFSLFADPKKYKPDVIEPLLKQFPKRRFILVGDSGERDPEIYAALARKFPHQIEHIYIRDVSDESVTAPRYVKAFAGLAETRWTIFDDPAELKK